ncbi:carbonic anhydrase [[Pantoea] beijingensis]|uniref:Carbonic anhydrase n=1 Tax=[Pantoea] beijingensis TaxID=1324864 RepID=A0A443IC50_9GAMM|nr:carbonic anhydrase family protein [[Pantoea] beijingensis]RWR01575.1 carbonic anhydrase [[Pantoea] beijingensis]
MIKKLICTLTLFLAGTPALQASPSTPSLSPAATVWSYEGKGSPEHWSELSDEFQTCKKGHFQSPIDINHVIKGNLPPLDMVFHTQSESIVNNGHTIQVMVKDGEDFLLDGQQFTLQQFHFHTPSENLINGKSFPLEAHFVHSNPQGEVAVVAVMFEEGEVNPQLETILQKLPKAQNKVEPLEAVIDLGAFFPQDKHYYRFSGSLTTPPCTEGLRWLVIKQPETISKAQITAFQQALKHANNRPLQPLHGRMIVE